MIRSKAVRRQEWDRDYGSFGPVRGTRFDEKSGYEAEQGAATATESREDMIQAPSESRYPTEREAPVPDTFLTGVVPCRRI